MQPVTERPQDVGIIPPFSSQQEAAPVTPLVRGRGGSARVRGARGAARAKGVSCLRGQAFPLQLGRPTTGGVG